MISKSLITKHLKNAGISINGNHPYDVQIFNDQIYSRLKFQPSLEAGESYMEGWWDCEQLDEFFYRICKHTVDAKFQGSFANAAQTVLNTLFNLQSKVLSLQVAKEHYNLGNDFYAHMLGSSMAYTCGYWREAKTLDEAQYHKFDLICRKIGLQPGERVLELGCGWGTFAKYVAENYGCEVVAVNIAEEQVAFAREIGKDLPIVFHQCDYRDSHLYNSDGKPFDKVISIGLCEHVGYKNYQTFAETIRNNLREDGLALVHTIGKDFTDTFTDPWIKKYIFPNSILPTIKLLSSTFEKRFVIEDLHNFGADYDLTLMEWYKNFVENWDKFKDSYGEKFFRKWKYYLLSCAGAFRARSMQLWQIVLSPHGVPGGYKSIR